MSYYSVDPCDTSKYGDLFLPTLKDTIKLVSAFDLAACKQLCKTVKSSKKAPSGLYDSKHKEIVTNQRSSSVCSVDWQTYNYVAERITFVANYHLKAEIGQLRLSEGIQFLMYDAENNGRFMRHTDSAWWHGDQFMLSSPHRKISTVTYLNDDYEGGDLILDTVKNPEGQPFRKKMEIGEMILFPSDIRYPHEVTPVTQGTRFSIVAWFDLA